MNRYQAHVTDEWQTDTMVIQVRRLAHNDTTQAVAYLAEDRDGMATVMWHHIDMNRDGREHLDPTPGVRIPHDVAVAMARAILTEAGKDADEVERLKGQVENQRETIQNLGTALDAATAERDRLATQVEGMERLTQVLEHAADREARTATVFIRGLEMHQGTAEVEAERANHPARTIEFPDLQRKVNDTLDRMGLAQQAATFPQRTD